MSRILILLTAVNGQIFQASGHIDPDWLRKATRGRMKSDDLAASEFETLYNAHHRAVLAYCARRASRTDAWDAASEVFVVAWRRLNQVPAGDEARPWLFGVAYRVLSNQRRSAYRRRNLFKKAAAAETQSGQMSDEPVVRSDEENQVVTALEKLRADDREIIQLACWEDLTPTEISGILGISRNAVDKRYSRAKQRLARDLEAHRKTKGNATPTTARKGGAT